MSERPPEISQNKSDNVIQPFSLESSNLRGRIIRVGDVLNNVLEPHGYPNPVAHLVAETMALTMLLSSMLKYEGIFTLQTQGDGPVSMLVSDLTSEGILRGCASFDEERLQHAREQLSALKAEESAQNHLAQYLGKGHIAFTVDSGAHERYQGIVELKGSSLIDCVQHYFTQSEQIGTGIKMAIGLRDGKWRAGGIMLQHLPEDQQNPRAGHTNTRDDEWRRAMILLDTCTDHELLDPNLHEHELLTRLFHEEGVRIYDSSEVKNGCRCDKERIFNVLQTMPDEDLEHMEEDGVLSLTCEFCSTVYSFGLKDVKKAIKDKVSQA
ncbi:MAG: Hsp33 family molecular chaperone HslO [Pseudomonadota bacterium]